MNERQIAGMVMCLAGVIGFLVFPVVPPAWVLVILSSFVLVGGLAATMD